VDLLMNVKLTQLTKGVSTSGRLAHVRLGASVDIVMVNQVLLGGEESAADQTSELFYSKMNDFNVSF
jgi:hypothetical protein